MQKAIMHFFKMENKGGYFFDVRSRTEIANRFNYAIEGSKVVLPDGAKLTATAIRAIRITSLINEHGIEQAKKLSQHATQGVMERHYNTKQDYPEQDSKLLQFMGLTA